MNRSVADGLLSEFGTLIGLPDLQADALGCCQLVFDQDWLVTLAFQLPQERVFLHCPISAPGAAQTLEPSVLMAMLQGSFMGRGAAGGTLAIGLDGRACVQCELHLAHTDGRLLVSVVERLLMSAETWSRRLHGPVKSGPPRKNPAATAFRLMA